MPNGTYGGVRGRKTKVGRKLLRFPPTRLKYNWRLLRRGHRYPEQVAFTRLSDVLLIAHNSLLKAQGSLLSTPLHRGRGWGEGPLTSHTPQRGCHIAATPYRWRH